MSFNLINASESRKNETCYLCGVHCTRSNAIPLKYGYETIFLCSHECNTVVNSFLRSITHYKSSFSYENLEKSVRHYCYSNRCRTSSYNLNVSLIYRCAKYYAEVRFGTISLGQHKEHIRFLLSNDYYGDEWSHEDPYLED